MGTENRNWERPIRNTIVDNGFDLDSEHENLGSGLIDRCCCGTLENDGARDIC